MAKDMENYGEFTEDDDQPYEGVSADYYNDGASTEWVDEEGLDEEHDVKFEETQDFWMFGKWGNGYLPVMDGPKETKETLSGLYIPAETGIAPQIRHMPQNLQQVLDKLVDAKKMRR